MEWWHAIILGLVEGITEYLPVSSTGHLIIVSDLLGLGRSGDDKAFKAFEVVIQGGAILAVLGLYWARFEQMILGVFGLNPRGRKLLINVGIGFLPVVVAGPLLHNYVKDHLMYPGPVIGAFIVGGIYMIGVEQWYKRHAKDLPISAPVPAESRIPTAEEYAASYSDARAPAPAPVSPPAGPVQRGKEIDDLTPMNALTIGLLQILSMWPGTSRSMMTITGGMMVGLKPAAAAEFSFLLGMPTLLAATVFVLGKDLGKYFTKGTPTMFEKLSPAPVLIGLLVAAVSAAFAVKWLVGFLNRNGLTPFGIYRLVFAAILLGLVYSGRVDIKPDAPSPVPAVGANGVPVLPEMVAPK